MGKRTSWVNEKLKTLLSISAAAIIHEELDGAVRNKSIFVDTAKSLRFTKSFSSWKRCMGNSYKMLLGFNREWLQSIVQLTKNNCKTRVVVTICIVLAISRWCFIAHSTYRWVFEDVNNSCTAKYPVYECCVNALGINRFLALSLENRLLTGLKGRLHVNTALLFYVVVCLLGNHAMCASLSSYSYMYQPPLI